VIEKDRVCLNSKKGELEMAYVLFCGNVRIDLVVKKSRCVHGYFDY